MIKIAKENCPNTNDRILELVGTVENMKNSLMLILKKIRLTDLRNCGIDQEDLKKFFNAKDGEPGDYGGYSGYSSAAARGVIPGQSKSSANDTSTNSAYQDNKSTYCSWDIRKTVISTPCKVRFLITFASGGKVIGGGGGKINHFRDKFRLIVKCMVSDTADRIVNIFSDRNENNLKAINECLAEMLPTMAVDLAEKAVDQGYKLRSGSMANVDPNIPAHYLTSTNADIVSKGFVITEFKLLIHTKMCSKIVGDKGSNIKMLRSQYNLDIKMYDHVCPNSSERVCSLSGTVRNILSCTWHILSMVADFEPPDKHQYNGNFDPLFRGHFKDYGGFINDYTGQQSMQAGTAVNTFKHELNIHGKQSYTARYLQPNFSYSELGYVPGVPVNNAQLFRDTSSGEHYYPTRGYQPDPNMGPPGTVTMSDTRRLTGLGSSTGGPAPKESSRIMAERMGVDQFAYEEMKQQMLKEVLSEVKK